MTFPYFAISVFIIVFILFVFWKDFLFKLGKEILVDVALGILFLMLLNAIIRVPINWQGILLLAFITILFLAHLFSNLQNPVPQS